MAERKWVMTRGGDSWHLVNADYDVSRTMCGKRSAPGTLRDERPGNEKTCENCLRLVTGR